MPVTAAQKALVFELLGIPAYDSAVALEPGPLAGDVQARSVDYAAVRTVLDQRMDGLSVAHTDRLAALLARYSALGASQPLRVVAGGSARGVLADAPGERAALRSAVSNLLGVAVPAGGIGAFVAGGAGRVER